MAAQLRNILVTGSEGSIGQYIVQELYRKYDNINIIRTGRNNNQNEDGKSHYVYGDLTDLKVYTEIFNNNNIDTIINCAAKWNGLNQDPSVLSTNTLLMNGLLYAIPSTVDQVIFFSSSAVYSKNTFSDLIEINSFPASTYGASKLFSEELLKQTAKYKGFDYTIYRPFHVVSPAEVFMLGRSHVCTDFCHKIISLGTPLPYEKLGDTNGIGFAWVEDVASVVADNLQNKKARNQTFNIGTEEEHSIRELALEITSVAYENKLIDFMPPQLRCRSPLNQTDGRFDKLNDQCPEAIKTNFKTMVRKFIHEKYLKEAK